MLKLLIKSSWIWKKFISSDLYYRYKDPSRFKMYRVEYSFYKKILHSHPYKNDLIFDVVANVGGKSFIFLKLAKKVIAFEPSERLFRVLEKRFQQENVLIFNCALGSSVASIDFFIVEDNKAYNSLNKKHIESTATKRGIATKDKRKCKTC